VTADAAGPIAALQGLERALAEALSALAGMSEPRRSTAMTIVLELDRVLARYEELAAVTEPLLARADLGDGLAAELRKPTAQLEQLRAELAPLRQELDHLDSIEGELHAALEEQREVEARLATLRRLQRLAADLPELRQQRLALEKRSRDLVDEAERDEQALASAAEELARVAGERIADLNEDVRRRVQEACDRQAEVEEKLRERERKVSELDTARDRMEEELRVADGALLRAGERHDRMRDELQRTLLDLERYAGYDREVADALGGPASVEVALVEVRERLQQIDGGLRRAIEARQRDHEAEHARRLPGPS
jgi:DNA repair exonuclease SbcCD ATPase subunit